MTYRKKLIEVALPLEAINKASARGKSIRHGHPCTLHLWWARRPLAACRAVIFASLVDDPDDPDAPPEVVAEREAYLLYDRMVAFHIQRGFSVPLGAAEFYAGLRQRFPERDGMHFLSHQAPEHDRHRLRAKKVEQLALFVTDEKSAIQWLRRELDPSTGSGPRPTRTSSPSSCASCARHATRTCLS